MVRHLATVFCYGTNMGPSQAARLLVRLDRPQSEWINQHHVVEDGPDEASTIVVNGYYRFLLTRAWGSGKHVSADGTQWDTCERKLLAERHIRYGGFAYYHISELYIALFNHFIRSVARFSAIEASSPCACTNIGNWAIRKGGPERVLIQAVGVRYAGLRRPSFALFRETVTAGLNTSADALNG